MFVELVIIESPLIRMWINFPSFSSLNGGMIWFYMLNLGLILTINLTYIKCPKKKCINCFKIWTFRLHFRNWVLKKIFFFKDFIYLFLERGKGGRKGENHQCVVAFCMPPTGDLARNPDMCPAWKLNQWPFGSQASAQSTEPHQPGLENTFLY